MCSEDEVVCSWAILGRDSLGVSKKIEKQHVYDVVGFVSFVFSRC